VRQVLAFAVSEERILTNPAALIAPPAEVTARKRTLNDVELRLFWEALESDDELWVGDESARRRLYVGPPMRILLKLALLLLVRRGELAGMRVDELDLDHGAWLIPGPRTKSGAPHFVPLSERAVELIREAIELAGTDGKAPICVFPSPRSSEKPIRADSVTHAMTGLCTALGLPSAAPHDLRRTGATLMTSERLRISPFIRSKVLSHRTDAGGGAMVSMLHYDSNEYVAEKRGALEAWANLLMQIVGEIAVDNNVRRLDDSPGFRR
jgi:integrase